VDFQDFIRESGQDQVRNAAGVWKSRHSAASIPSRLLKEKSVEKSILEDRNIFIAANNRRLENGLRLMESGGATQTGLMVPGEAVSLGKREAKRSGGLRTGPQGDGVGERFNVIQR